MSDKLKVLFLSSEAVPYAKTGGLADVAGSLPLALKKLGIDIRLVLPLYSMVRKGNFPIRPLIENLEVPLGMEMFKANILETRADTGLPVYLIERDDLYDRPNLYGNSMGDYYDNLERFTFFTHAALCIIQAISFKPDLIHCNDWQTGLIPALIKGPYHNNPFIREIPAVFTIHNLGYQGIFPSEKLSVTGLLKEKFFHPEGIEFWKKISLLKAGIIYSEAITTVSPTYAKEIQTSEYGMGMDGILHHRRAFLYGILNGVDYKLWNPETDTHIPAHYSLENIGGKAQCKESLIKEMGLKLSLKTRPVLGMTTRLDTQKGLDLFVEILNDILNLDVGLVILGSGDEDILQDKIRAAAEKHPGLVGLKIGFDESIAHRIMAGVDIFLIPSRYEPCGLTQMYALKYGTIPVVRATGGLEDTIIPFDIQSGEGNGFKFGHYKPEALFKAVQDAVELFQNSNAWEKIRENGMKADFSWNRSARAYLEIYQSLVRD
ncbi:MAG: glycogen synthase GlgA [Thermodesulfobacteriota bacterium]|nr:glycogen synthase GlgA [Thermodesulfobacteriota bacterium]